MGAQALHLGLHDRCGRCVAARPPPAVSFQNLFKLFRGLVPVPSTGGHLAGDEWAGPSLLVTLLRDTAPTWLGFQGVQGSWSYRGSTIRLEVNQPRVADSRGGAEFALRVAVQARDGRLLWECNSRYL